MTLVGILLDQINMAENFLPFTKPFVDEQTIAEVADVLRSGWLTTGPKVLAFEAQLSAYFDGRPVRTFNSATAALQTALRIAVVAMDDEVITTPLSWIATSNVIVTVGARPVFVDIDPLTRNIDLDKVEAAITARTKAIIPVYLSGLPVDIDRLYAIARKHGLRVIEDAAQAFGSTWKGRKIGAFGDLVAFSFHANKNITTAEGGALVMNNIEEAKLAEKYRLHGFTRTDWDQMDVDLLSGKFNMTDIAAAMGIGQFRNLEQITLHRRALADHYFTCFGSDFTSEYGVQLPIHDRCNSNWHMFQLVLPDRGHDKLTRATFMEKMREKGVGIGCHYPAIHLFTLYRRLGFEEGMFPVAERVGRLIVTLPLFYSMTKTDVERVVNAVKAVLLATSQG